MTDEEKILQLQGIIMDLKLCLGMAWAVLEPMAGQSDAIDMFLATKPPYTPEMRAKLTQVFLAFLEALDD